MISYFIKIVLIIFIGSISLLTAQTKVSLELKWKHQFQFAGYYMAKEKGFYDVAELDVTIIEGGNKNLLSNVESTKVDFGVSSSGILRERLLGRPFVALGVIMQHSPLVWLVREDSGIKKLSDFVGKKVMTHAEHMQSAELLAMFKHNGIAQEDINIIDTSYNVNSLINKEVDAFNAYISNEPYQLQLEGIKYKIFNPRNYGVDFYSDILFTSEAMIQNNPDVVKAFTEASFKGWEYAFEHIDETVELILKKYNTQNKTKEQLLFEANELKKLTLTPIVDIGHMTEERWEKIAQFFKALKFLEPDVEINLDGFIYKTEPQINHIWLIWTSGVMAIILLVMLLLYSQKHKYILKLEKAQEKFRTLYNSAPDMYVSVSPDTTIIECNDTLLREMGYTREEVIGSPIFKMYHEDCLEEVRNKVFKRFLETGVIRNKELILKRKDGSKLYVSLNIDSARDEDGNILHSISSLREIGDIKAVQDELKRNEYLLSESQRVAHLGSWQYNIASKAIFWSEELYNIFEIDIITSPITRKLFFNLIHPADANITLVTYVKSLKEKKPYSVVFRLVMKDGSIKHVEAKGETEYDESGKPLLSKGTIQDVTQRVMQEQRLIESEHRYREFFEDNSAVMLQIEPQDGIIINANKSALEFYGYTHTQMQKMNIKEINQLCDKECTNFEFIHKLSSGELRNVSVYSSPVKYGAKTHLFSIIFDITQEKKLKAEYKQLFDTVQDAIAIYGVEDEGKRFIFKDINDALLNIENLNRDDIIGRDVTEIFPGIEAMGLLNILKEVYKTGKPQQFSDKFYKDNRISGWRRNYTYKLPNGDIATMYEDLTKEYANAELLQHTKENLDFTKNYFEAVFNAEDDFIFTITYNIGTDRANDALLEFLGYEDIEAFSKEHECVSEFFEEDDGGYLTTQTEGKLWLDYIIDNPDIDHKILMHKDEKEHIFSIHTYPIALDNKNCYVVVLSDITSLIHHQHKYQNLVENIGEWVWEVDSKGYYTYTNSLVQDMLGYSAEEMIGKNFLDFMYDKDEYILKTDGFAKSLKSKSGYKDIISRQLHKDGSLIITRSNLQPILDEKHGFAGFRGTNVDITKQVTLEDELKASKEMIITQSRQAAMGDMVSMIAHQWRQPIAVVAMAVNNLKADMELEEEITPQMLDDTFGIILEQTKYMSETIEHFRNFLKIQNERSRITVTHALNDTVKLLEKTLYNNIIELVIDGESNHEIFTYSNEMIQVFLNIINNAKDALLSSKVDNPSIHISVDETDSEINITICDNGGGIDREILAHLGEPYVSSKSMNGAGLGIYMSKTIVEKHLNGTLSWENRDGRACFIVSIPFS